MEMVFGVLGAVIGVLGVVFGLATAIRNKQTDDKTEGEKDGVVLTELGYIKKGIDGIEKRLERQERQYIDVVRQLTEVKDSAKQAHRRIDALELYHKPKE